MSFKTLELFGNNYTVNFTPTPVSKLLTVPLCESIHTWPFEVSPICFGKGTSFHPAARQTTNLHSVSCPLSHM